MAGAYKFGNLFLNRVSKEVAELLERDPSGGNRVGSLGETVKREVHKLGDVANFHVGEMVTSIRKTTLIQGGAPVLLYSTLVRLCCCVYIGNSYCKSDELYLIVFSFFCPLLHCLVGFTLFEMKMGSI